jgi:hypothetical protein
LRMMYRTSSRIRAKATIAPTTIPPIAPEANELVGEVCVETGEVPPIRNQYVALCHSNAMKVNVPAEVAVVAAARAVAQ